MANAFLSLMTEKDMIHRAKQSQLRQTKVTLRSHITMNNIRFIQDLDGINTVWILLFTSQKHLSVVRNVAKTQQSFRQISDFTQLTHG
jgi:hypothetical protein